MAGVAAAHAGHDDHGFHAWDLLPGLDQALVFFALGLALGRFESDKVEIPVVTAILSIAVGAVVGAVASGYVPPSFRAVPLFAGGLLALDPGERARKLAPLCVGFIAATAAIAYGARMPWTAGSVTYIGFAAAASTALVVLGLLLWQRFYQPWFRIAIRVVGSWLLAVAIILLGASFRTL